MKNIILSLLLFAAFQPTSAQEFQKTDVYYVIFTNEIGEGNSSQTIASLFLDEQTPVLLATFRVGIDALAFPKITILQDPGLAGVHEIIKIDMEYPINCNCIVSQYFLATANHEFISLPRITNSRINRNTEIKYVFPNQKFGEVNKIMKTKSKYSKIDSVETVVMQQSHVWNDDDFGNSGAISDSY